MAVQAVEAPGRIQPLLRFVPGAWSRRMAAAGIGHYARDVAQDVPIWEAKG